MPWLTSSTVFQFFMRRRIAVIVPFFFLAGCNGEDDGYSVRVEAGWFAPQEIDVPVGGVVTWKTFDDEHGPHTVTPLNVTQWGTEGSGNDPGQLLRKGQSWAHTFQEVGEYRYRCIPHSYVYEGEWVGMVGVVRAGVANATAE